MRFNFLFSFLILSSSAFASVMPSGTFTLEKGTIGCPTEVVVDKSDSCRGFILVEMPNLQQMDLCNLNGGKYMRRWTEESIKFSVESKTTQVDSLFSHKEIRKAMKDKKVLKRAENSASIFFRGGRLELNKDQAKGKDLTCLYRRENKVPALTATAGAQ